MDNQLSIASIQLPDFTQVNHPVGMIYDRLSPDINFKFLLTKFFNEMFIGNYTIEMFHMIFTDPNAKYTYFADSFPNMPMHVADSYIAFYLQLIEFLKDKYETYKNQAYTIKQITTGLPNITRIELQRHYAGWYIVIY